MKYIEIAVPDDFDDTEKTTYDAVDSSESITDASPVSRADLQTALEKTLFPILVNDKVTAAQIRELYAEEITKARELLRRLGVVID